MKNLVKIVFLLLIILALKPNSINAQSEAEPKGAFDIAAISLPTQDFNSFLNIELGAHKNEIKYPLANYSEKDVYGLDKDTLGLYYNSRVKKCLLKFDNKDVLTEMTIAFSAFAYSTNQDTIQKKVDYLYNRIKAKAGECTKQKKAENYFEYLWVGEKVKLEYIVELASDGMGLFGGQSGVIFSRTIKLKMK